MFPATRLAALERLDQFLETGSRYAKERNFVRPGHESVSRLSPAIRHGLLTTDEASRAALDRYAFSTVEKFVQELWWRTYWKGWLEMRPQVWRQWTQQAQALRTERSELVERAEQGETGVAIMDHFARELRATGYLHNHARMWYAAFWVHELKLPWEAGADFFFRELLDGDSASNTLSWRWVAGRQTPGKSYLARRSNLEKYLDPKLLAAHRAGLERLEQPQALDPGEVTRIPANLKALAAPAALPEGPLTLWVHEEDLSPETIPGEWAERVERVLLAPARSAWDQFDFSERKCQWLEAALTDAQERLCERFPGRVERLADLAEVSWDSRTVAAYPDQGVVRDALAEGARPHWLFREAQVDLYPQAKGGFFGFWKKLAARWQAGELFLR
ncbi:MAG: FAD-binding domain-containing protein [Verrucomicrobiota bacterium]